MKIKYNIKPDIRRQVKEYFTQLGIPMEGKLEKEPLWKNKKGRTYGMNESILALSSWSNCIKLSEGIDKIKEWIDKQELT